MQNRTRTNFIKMTGLTLGTAVLLLGCTVGPDYKKPDEALPATWVTPLGDMVLSEKDATQENWWKNFNDPVLEALITRSLASNLDLQIAEARISEARATRETASSALLPQGSAVGQATRADTDLKLPGGVPLTNGPINFYEAGFDASWELDLFGGHRRDIEASEANLEASEASLEDVKISLLAEVARTYIDIKADQAQIAVTEDTIQSNKNTLRIAEERFNVGDTAGIDVTQAHALLSSAETQLPYYRNMLKQAEYSMDVLLGEEPGAAESIIGKDTSIPVSDKKLILGAPASVIANRPDIHMAERKLAAATAEQGVAVAQFFPDISLSGFVGLLDTSTTDLLSAGGKTWMLGGKVMWPILSYGKLEANLDSANAEQQEAMTAYKKTILEALSDVERSLTAYIEQENFRQSLTKTVAENRDAARISQERYKEGLTNFLEVLDAERTLYASEGQLAKASADTSEDLIAVYKSLGGGWK